MEALILSYDGHEPVIPASVFVAPGAIVIGRVEIGDGSSIWYGSVLRGDEDRVVLGTRCNVQDGSILHSDIGQPTILGDRVTLGHGALVHSATIEDDVLIGMRATVLNGARVGRGSFVAAGCLVPPGMDIPPGSLVMGIPGRIERPVNDHERDLIAKGTEGYMRLATSHRNALREGGSDE